MRVIGGLIAVAIAATPSIVAAPHGTASGQRERLVFTVGYWRDFDSLNPTVGVTVAAYEAWNLHYATLTGKSAKDFSVTPGLAESWKPSNRGKTYTYKLRPHLKWSDGKRLTAEDIAYTVNRSRADSWINHSAVTANLRAKVIDPTTVAITSKVPDPKLPALDVYIVPKHVYERYDEKELRKYDGQDGVGSGPYVLEAFKKGQFARFKANRSFWGGKPPLAAVVIRTFKNAETMAAALRRGEIDAAHDITGAAFDRLEDVEDIEVIEGSQGSFVEFALNGGDGLKEGHPALSDQLVRRAIAHAIDKPTVVERVERGHATVADTISPSANPDWMPDVPEEEQFAFDLDRANALLDEGGYADTDGDGVRELPGGGQPLRMRYAVRSESPSSGPTAGLITGWLRDIGIATSQQAYDDAQLTEVLGKGDYDMFVWGWTPFVDPDPMLSYLTCDQIASDRDDPTDNYNDMNYCDREYDRLYEQQKVELDRVKRRELVHRALRRLAASGAYNALYLAPDLQAYRTDQFEGFVRQPEGVGPVLFSSTSPTYLSLKPVSATSGGGGHDGGGTSAASLIGVGIAAALAGAWAIWVVMRRRAIDERW